MRILSLHWHIYPLITTVNKMQASCLVIPQVSLPPPPVCCEDDVVVGVTPAGSAP